MNQRSVNGDGAARALSQHILPSAGTMIGVCTTLVGLVKIAEGQIGPSHADEAVSLTALLFLASAAASYLSMRLSDHRPLAIRLERLADICFVIGLLGMSTITLLFAYETI